MWWYLTPYATVDGQKISRSEYNNEISRLKKFYTFSSSSNGLKNLSTEAENQLVEEKIIEQQAQKMGITVSDEEINNQYNSIVKNYGSEAAFEETIKANYGWRPALTKESIKVELLQQKLEPLVLKGYDVTELIVRYDMGPKRGHRGSASQNPKSAAIYKSLCRVKPLNKLAQSRAVKHQFVSFLHCQW